MIGDPLALRFTLLAIIVIGTAIAALTAFKRSVASPVLLTLACFFIQPVLSLGLDAITGKKLNVSNGLLGGGLALVAIAIATKKEFSLRASEAVAASRK